jgi:hypothetical protein
MVLDVAVDEEVEEGFKLVVHGVAVVAEGVVPVDG